MTAAKRAPLTPLTYAGAGVDTVGAAGSLQALRAAVEETFTWAEASPLLPLGYFANVIRLTPDTGLAIATDGVGTKLLIAREMGRFDTVGIDCVAMNANDILCVGARPLAMVDYVAVEHAEPAFLNEIVGGVCAGARLAGISVPGGEIAQVGELLHPAPDGRSFDVVGTCIGTVHPDRVLVGAAIRPGDVVIGLAASGLHSNGYTMARRALLDRAGMSLDDKVGEGGSSLGEVLLTPTRIYVKSVLRLWDDGFAVKAMAHITGDGLLNLARVKAEVGFVLDGLPDPIPVFDMIRVAGEVEIAEMYRVFNMGIGFCLVVSPEQADRVVTRATELGESACLLGYAVTDPLRRVWLPGPGLVGCGARFEPLSGAVPPRP